MVTARDATGFSFMQFSSRCSTIKTSAPRGQPRPASVSACRWPIVDDHAPPTRRKSKDLDPGTPAPVFGGPGSVLAARRN
jgi:hypothetical protein